MHEKMLTVAKLRCDIDAPDHNIEWAEEEGRHQGHLKVLAFITYTIFVSNIMVKWKYSKSLVEHLFFTAWTLMFRF